MPVSRERALISSGIRPKKCPMPSAGSRTRPCVEADPLDRIVDRGDDSRRRVVRVERRSARGFVFLRRKQRLEAFAFSLPFSRAAARQRPAECRPSRHISRGFAFRRRSRRGSRASSCRTSSIAAKLSRHFCFSEPSPRRSSARMR